MLQFKLIVWSWKIARDSATLLLVHWLEKLAVVAMNVFSHFFSFFFFVEQFASLPIFLIPRALLLLRKKSFRHSQTHQTLRLERREKRRGKTSFKKRREESIFKSTASSYSKTQCQITSTLFSFLRQSPSSSRVLVVLHQLHLNVNFYIVYCQILCGKI